MDLELAKMKRKWGIVLGAFGFTCYGAYTVYTLPSFVKKNHRLLKLFSAFFSVLELVSDSSDAIGILSKDLKQFLSSDSDQIPQSFKQLSKIAQSNEFSESLTRVTKALAIGILRGYQHGNGGDSNMVLDKLFSEAGSGFASVVVGSFAKNLVTTLYSEWERASLKSDESIRKLVEIACDDKFREMIGDAVRVFVSTAVTVYLDKTINVNTYDEFFEGLTNPKHEARVRDMLVSLCNGAVETGVQTSYGVWSANGKATFGEDGFNGMSQGKKSRKGRSMMRNRRFVLDMTFESIRSFVEFLVEKVLECIRRSVDVVRREVAETMRYVNGKSCAVTSVCLNLCLNILDSPWILAPY